MNFGFIFMFSAIVASPGSTDELLPIPDIKQPAAWHFSNLVSTKVSTKQTARCRPIWTINQTQQNKEAAARLLERWLTSYEKRPGIHSFDLTRYIYDPRFGSFTNPQSNNQCANSIATGRVRINSDRNSCLEIDQVFDLQATNQTNGTRPKYRMRKSECREKWIRFGDTVIEFDFSNHVVYESYLPEQKLSLLWFQFHLLLPFQFRMDHSPQMIADDFWIRLVTESTKKREYWLQFVEKKDQGTWEDCSYWILLEESGKQLIPKVFTLEPLSKHLHQSRSLTIEYSNHSYSADQSKQRSFCDFDVPKNWRLLKRNLKGN